MIFQTKHGNPICYRYTDRVLERIQERQGLPTTQTIHDLRHTFSTVQIANGTDVKTLSEWLGHSTIAMTLAIYVHSTKESRAHVVDVACQLTIG